jgi:hypothetical protein
LSVWVFKLAYIYWICRKFSLHSQIQSNAREKHSSQGAREITSSWKFRLNEPDLLGHYWSLLVRTLSHVYLYWYPLKLVLLGHIPYVRFFIWELLVRGGIGQDKTKVTTFNDKLLDLWLLICPQIYFLIMKYFQQFLFELSNCGAQNICSIWQHLWTYLWAKMLQPAQLH